MKRVLKGLLGLGLATVGSLLLAEAIFWFRDDGAFPHVNFYVEDPVLAVRLAPNAHERLSVAGNPANDLRTNSLGFRGGEWEEADGTEVLVLGDSQVFGLGVEEGETASAELARQLGVPVRNAGVPTYGPPEYLKLTKELVEKRHPRTVVVVLNMANDWFERERINLDRHAVWDGWAVRKETAPKEIKDFPGRHWLYSQSHLFFAGRKALYESETNPRPGPDESESRNALASEGGPSDLLGLSHRQHAALVQGLQPVVEKERRLNAEMQQQLETTASEMDMLRELGYYMGGSELINGNDIAALQTIGRKVQPGDIVWESLGEGARETKVTAEMILRGAELRKQLPDRLRAWLKANPEPGYGRGVVEDALAAMTGHHRVLTGANVIAESPPPVSPFHQWLAEMKAACGSSALMVVALPLDLQVAPEEWKKYGNHPQDMSASEYLLSELASDASYQQIRVLNALPTLRSAEPGAFLRGDIHMTAKGQVALGQAIAAVLKGPPPPPPPQPGLPVGRSRLPLPDEWENGKLVQAGCRVFQVREWVKLECVTAQGLGTVKGVKVLEGPLETMSWGGNGIIRVVSPLLKDRILSVDVVLLEKGRFHFEISSADPLHPKVEFKEDSPSLPVPSDCAVSDAVPVRFDQGCSTLDGCELQLACATGRRDAFPTCEAGFVNAGATGWCFQLCSDQLACAQGVCTDWQGTKVCL